MIDKEYPFDQTQPRFTFIINLCFFSATQQVSSQQIFIKVSPFVNKLWGGQKIFFHALTDT